MQPAPVHNVRELPRSRAFIPVACCFIFSCLASYVFYRLGCSLLGNLSTGAAVISVGIVPPRWFGWHERARRAVRAKSKEKGKWGFHSRDRDVPWVAYIEGPLIVQADCAKGKCFYGEWLIIHNGYIIVNPGCSVLSKSRHRVRYFHKMQRTYAWDGCSPKRSWFWVLIIGTPDWWQRKLAITTWSARGALERKEVFWPMTHYASVVHDALYQYLRHIPITPEEADRLFFDMLKECGMRPAIAKVYYWAVKCCGGREVKRDGQAKLPQPVAASPLLLALGPPSKECSGNPAPSVTTPLKSLPS